MQGITEKDFKVYAKPVIQPDLPFDGFDNHDCKAGPEDGCQACTQRRLEAQEHNETIESALNYAGN